MAVARRSTVTPTAVYCTVPPPRDPDQTPADEQENQCRATARERSLVVPPNLVFADTVRACWQPGHTRPGWESLIEAMAPRRFRTLIVYHPEWQLRRPADLLALLAAADAHRIVLIAHCSGWDLSDAAFRRELRGRAAQAERNAERVSQRARADHARAADEGRAHGGGLRAFGYAPGLAAIIEHEAATIREIYAQYLANTGPARHRPNPQHARDHHRPRRRLDPGHRHPHPRRPPLRRHPCIPGTYRAKRRRRLPPRHVAADRHDRAVGERQSPAPPVSGRPVSHEFNAR